ncbi:MULTISPECIES: glutamate racemase [unclassified Pseudoalteromonas]|uniref:glutamate racemase n=1 Tax=unclassified Pseudoalteromonas TaxID=194690 RepID=UPI0005616643|nr:MULTISPECIES: glutamate racemase [unclassified Pseudoalteromonas]MDN3396928.1 glutamate racemase [Pseudoalteromonas sp. APC 3215]MDN3432694.1 glutamate racemase [Pseudoalteromonas sp. APC 3907]MDN3466678.1 glutamate racemase [Pseudoalteromonas sp. APC 3495]MDN3472565.1 glutamate racemase [Pseudoalteromonas sp. APC 4026]QWF32476.1 glutamate racemase [Pseudoalteromonas sp. SiA1]
MSAHIMVFDSGIGGTTVLEHIQQSIPHAQYSYFMDNALLPYGAQSQQTIINRLCGLIQFIKDESLNVDLIVIACNTASTSALSSVRQITDIPIVGVVPAIKPAAQLTQSKHIGLLATPATVSSPYTDALIKEHASSITTSLYSSVELVTLAETLFFTQHLDIDKLHTELDRLNINNDIDVLVLGCTHFPILAKPISDYFNTQVQLLDSGAAIAKRVSSLLKLSNNQAGIKKPLHYYATADVCSDKLAVKQVTLFDPTLNDKS